MPAHAGETPAAERDDFSGGGFPRPRPIPGRRRQGTVQRAAPPGDDAPPVRIDWRSPVAPAEQWMAARGWTPFAFQRQVWQAIAQGRSGLLHAATGTGKTLAVYLGLLQALSEGSAAGPALARTAKTASLTILWITPMRALAADTLRALAAPLADFAPHWRVGARTGDTGSAERARQSRRLPSVLITTPESLSLLLSRENARESFAGLRAVVVDEWHELLGNKRGVQTQLALARLSGWHPPLRVWGLSATLANLREAMRTLLPAAPPGAGRRPGPKLVRGRLAKRLRVDTLLPAQIERFPWAGHLGLAMLPKVAAAIEESASTLVFVNTRAQAERWYRALLDQRPEWAGEIALHHGSLDRSVREWVEAAIKTGRLRAVVCTSSLDLGVDFPPVERVLQIGSAKAVGRLIQRAGRSGHAPGRASRITLVPTHTLEIVEAAAVRDAIEAGQIEPRRTPQAPLDVLVQHLVTVALGGGFRPATLLAEVRRTLAYRALRDDDWQWALDFVRRGGPSLTAYPDFSRAAPDAEGIWRAADARLARRHRSNIGTIVGDAAMQVRFVGGARLGVVEESFLARLRPGDVFLFAGRLLELVRIHEMTAQVRLARSRQAALPRWQGGRMALTGALAQALLRRFGQAEQGIYHGVEMRHVRPLLELQRRWSHLPTPATLLAETLSSREGCHLFLYPFAGRHVHLGLAALLAWRAARQQAGTFSMAIDEYGLELLSPTAVDWPRLLRQSIAPAADGAAARRALSDEVLAGINASEMARRRFREIARIAGLIFQSHPGERRSSRQLQASASLYYDVFARHDADNRLLAQARDEVLQRDVDIDALHAALIRMAQQDLRIVPIERPTPLAFPLMVERFRETLSNESLAARIERLLKSLHRQAERTAAATVAGKVRPPSAGERKALMAALAFEAQDAPPPSDSHEALA